MGVSPAFCQTSVLKSVSEVERYHGMPTTWPLTVLAAQAASKYWALRAASTVRGASALAFASLLANAGLRFTRSGGLEPAAAVSVLFSISLDSQMRSQAAV